MSQKKVRKFKKKKRSRPAGGPRKNPLPNPVEVKRREKADAPPTCPGVQDVPRSLKEFMKLKELAKESPKKKKTKNSNESKKPEKEIKAATSNDSSDVKNQSAKTQTAANSTSESQFADTFEPAAQKSSRQMSIKKKRKLKLEKLKMKRKVKKELKRQEIEEDEEKPDMVKEVIKFGEVVHRPPQISTLPRVVSRPGFQYRPGRADDRLIKSIMKDRVKNVPYKNQLCSKRKYLSVSDQRQLEVEKNKAMLMYENLKMKRARTKT